MTAPLAPRGYSAFGTSIAGQASHTIGTSAFFAEIIEMGEIEQTRDDIDMNATILRMILNWQLLYLL